ncbi:MAG: P-loop NTPase fold protein [bacterium]
MSKKQGFDSSHVDKSEDYPNRWPFAQEIYRIATSACPKDWSVRIGIYGEWGTGKTCVLDFIEQMAAKDDQIVILFNPWEFSDAKHMWQAFVAKVLFKLRPYISPPSLKSDPKTASKKITRSVLASKYTDIFAKFAGKIEFDLYGLNIGETIANSIDLLKEYFSFTHEEIEELSIALGDKRVIIIVDDLDRASSEVVPELFYGLKQILDIQGFSFICAFDPVVVGKILGETHKGFGCGLKFLDKIIDYPRWLQQPSPEGFRNLAHANIDKYCSFVPKNTLESILPLLPQNPRSIKQYIRLLALLETQLARHDAEELNWPVILLANVLKISFPQLAQDVISDLSFWNEIDTAVMIHVGHSSDPDPIPPIIQKRLDKCVKISNIPIAAAELGRLKSLLERLVKCNCSTLDTANTFHYFLHIAENPASMTHREYRDFFNAWEKTKDQATIAKRIVDHAALFSFKDESVFSSLLNRTINYRDHLLERTVNTPSTQEMKPLLDHVQVSFVLLGQLVFEVGGVSSATKLLTEEHLALLFESFFRYSVWRNTKEYRTLRKAEEDFLKRLVKEWNGDVFKIMKALQPLSQSRVAFASDRDKALRKELAKPILSRYSLQICEYFHQQGFVSSLAPNDASNNEINQILLDPDGPFWRTNSVAVYSMLKCAKNELSVQLNIFDLFHHFKGVLKSYSGHGPAHAVEKLLSKKRMSLALWKAATVSPLNNRFVGEMRDFPVIVQGFGVTLPIPVWWKNALESLDRK